jgi:hypothetical protein
MPAQAWSETDDSGVMPVGTGEYPKSGVTERPRPEKKDPIIPWYRLPAVLVVGTAVAVLLVGIAVVIGLGSDGNKPATPSTTPVSSVPATQPAPALQPPGTGQSQQAPPPEPTVTAPSTTNAPPPATTDTPTTLPPAAPQGRAAQPNHSWR